MSSTKADLTTEKVIEIVGGFLPSWKETKPWNVKVTKNVGGMVSATYFVERVRPATSGNDPDKLVIKKFEGVCSREAFSPEYLDIFFNDDIFYTMVAQEWSRTGFGYRLYGVFKEGRVEEFIEGGTLKHEELHKDEKLVKVVAESYAQFHSLNIPLAERTADILHGNLPTMKDESMTKLRAMGLDLSALYLDWVGIRRKMDHMLKAMKARVTLSHLDPNFLNIMIRSNPKPGQSKATLIDFDCSKYTYRCIDLGGHFIARALDWNRASSQGMMDVRSGYSYPSVADRMTFLKYYLAETRRLGYLKDFDPAGRDHPDNVLRESRIGSIIMIYSYMLGVAGMGDAILMNPACTGLMSAIEILGELYRLVMAEIEADDGMKCPSSKK